MRRERLYILDKLQIVGSQLRSAFKDGDNAAVAKAFVCAIFVEVEPTFLLVVEKVEVQLDCYSPV